MVSTVRPKASDTPTKPIHRPGIRCCLGLERDQRIADEVARDALGWPQVMRFDDGIALLLQLRTGASQDAVFGEKGGETLIVLRKASGWATRRMSGFAGPGIRPSQVGLKIRQAFSVSMHLGELNVDESIPEKALKSGHVTVQRLVVPDRIRQIANKPGRMTSSATSSFFTACACRAFRKHYYSLAATIFDKRDDARSMTRVVEAQENFLAGIESMEKAHAHWLDLDNTLMERMFVEIVELSPACARLRRLFMKLDQFLVPPYKAKIAGIIGQPALDEITDQVDTLLKALILSVDGVKPVVAGNRRSR